MMGALLKLASVRIPREPGARLCDPYLTELWKRSRCSSWRCGEGIPRGSELSIEPGEGGVVT